MSAFIVSKKASGVTVGNVVPFVGLKGLQVSELILEETAISLDSLLGTVGQGFEVNYLSFVLAYGSRRDDVFLQTHEVFSDRYASSYR